MRDYRSEAERRRDEEDLSPAAARFASSATLAPRLFGLGRKRSDREEASESIADHAAAEPRHSYPSVESPSMRSQAAPSGTGARASFDAGLSEQTEAALSPGGQRLWTTLLASASGVTGRAARLRAIAQSVDAALIRRREGDNRIAAVWLRILTGAAFLVVAVALNSSFKNAFSPILIEETASLLASERVTAIEDLAPADVEAARGRAFDRMPSVMGVAPVDVAGVVSLFSLVGFAAIGAALLHRVFMAAVGATSNAPIARTSQSFGDAIASMLEEIGESLEEAKRRLQTGGRGASEISRDVSEAHLAAEEAVLLFREVDFLAEDPHGRGWAGNAIDRYRAYLNGVRSGVTDRWLEYVTVGAVIGVLFMVFAYPSFLFFTLDRFFEIPPDQAREMISAKLPQSALSKYPKFAGGFAIGLGVFALAGVAGELLANTLSLGKRRTRLRQSLDTVRGAITSAEAPGARDIAMHVEALSAIFQERLAASKPMVVSPMTPSASAAAQSAPPAPQTDASGADAGRWSRAGDSTPRFVEPRFESAPKQWFADDSEAPRRLVGRRASPSKRGFPSFGSGDDR